MAILGKEISDAQRNLISHANTHVILSWSPNWDQQKTSPNYEKILLARNLKKEETFSNILGEIMQISRQGGGIDIRNLIWQYHALGAKLAWKIYSQPNLKRVRVIQVKYLNSDNRKEILRVPNPLKGSRIWNFILNSRKVLLHHISWDTFYGKSSLFWEDSWEGIPSINKLMDTSSFNDFFIQNWGTTLHFYVDLDSHHSPWGWRWKDFPPHMSQVD